MSTSIELKSKTFLMASMYKSTDKFYDGHNLLVRVPLRFFTIVPSLDNFNTMTTSVHQKSFDDSDRDSAISSLGSQVSCDSQDSACSCDSCICDLSFSTCDSTTESCYSPINPFGSFRHTGVLPYSLFEDSSSFSCSHVNDSTLQNSTHIYMNLMDQTDYSMVKTTKFWNSLADEDTTLSPRPACDGKEDSTLIEEDTSVAQHCNVHDVSNKVGPWLQNCMSILSTSEDDPRDTLTDTSVDSDATTFLELPLHRQPVTQKLSSKKRICLLKKLKEVGRFLQRQGKSKASVKTLAVL